MKKKILAGLLSAMMVVSLAACGSSETGATATESKSETTANTADGTAAAATDAQGGYEGKEVKVWISSGAEDDIYREMFDKIEGDLNITITDEYYSKDELFDSGLAFWANKSMLENAGVRIPADYKDAWDKAEFEDALKKLKDSGVEWPIYVRQNKPSTEYYTWMPFVASFGGDYMNRETGLCTGTLDGDNTIASFDFLAKLFTDGYADATCDYEDSFQKGENALALYGHSKYQDYKAALGDDLILVPLPDMGHGVYTCSGSTVMIMTTGAQESGNDDAVWAMLQEATNPDYIKMVVDVNGAVPARSSVMDAIPDYCEGGTLYLYRQQLESGISFLRPYTPAHMTIYDAMASVIGNIYAGADPATELHDAAANIDEIITENGWNFQ